MDINSRILDKRYSATAAELHVIRQDVRTTLFDIGLSPNQVDTLVLAVNEACTNIIEHAYGEQHSGHIVLHTHLVENEIIFEIQDFAPPMPNTLLTACNTDDSPGGLGIHFMQQLMDSVEFKHAEGKNGNIVTMKKRI